MAILSNNEDWKKIEATMKKNWARRIGEYLTDHWKMVLVVIGLFFLGVLAKGYL